LLCNIKHTSWSYEKEFRCTTGAKADGMPYIQAKPKEIFIGMNCTTEQIEQIIQVANKIDVPVHRMGFEECSSKYELVVSD
jgi:hypothetical protein